MMWGAVEGFYTGFGVSFIFIGTALFGFFSRTYGGGTIVAGPLIGTYIFEGAYIGGEIFDCAYIGAGTYVTGIFFETSIFGVDAY